MATTVLPEQGKILVILLPEQGTLSENNVFSTLKTL